ncbi:WD repeat protein [Niveomyces insectorum RCEF 264]|uniref:WD repeat protein n=1 Tax=Niveomyces insectorum RCEF 264 TaxID=1081102 RepID=A0A167UZ31_9HYPO|nr:WD repeat protein [Niveomyces insectorum RCEF 264]
MNLLLSEDYLLQDYPENITHTIRSGHATCLRFNRKGDYLASGRVDGTVVVWDLDTMGVARKLRGHSRSISSLSWSRCGRYLLSACQGWKAILWDLQDGRKYREVRFKAPVYIAELHPWKITHFVASIYEDQALIVDITDPVDVKHVLPSKPRRPATDDAALREKWAKEDAKQMTTVTIYAASGTHILAATNKGWINLIDAATRAVLFSKKACGGVVTTLRLNAAGRILLANAQDRIIRSLHLPDLARLDRLDPDTLQLPEEHKFQDVVNRLSWNHIALSPTGEYVAASTYNNHELYIWERHHGSLVRMLEGPKEEQGVIEWHPHRVLLAACGLETGRINIWSVTSPQKWSALAPDFAEVEENEVYVEREDEFDIHPPEELTQRRLDQEDEEVDVLTVAQTGADDDGLGLLPPLDGGGGGGGGGSDHNNHSGHGPPNTTAFRMPILYDLGESDSEEEFVTVSTGTMRRRSPGDGQSVDLEGDAGDAEERIAAKKTGSTRGGRTKRR